VGFFRVVRIEQLGQLLASVLDEVPDGPQPGENDQVTAVDVLSQFFRWDIKINVDGH
jgi:hypothetical protein